MYRIKMTVFLITFSVLFALIPSGAFAAVSQIDSAQMQVYASSYKGSSYPEAVLEQEDESSYYDSDSMESGKSPSIEIYLGGTYSVSELQVEPGATIQKWKVEYSEDGHNWQMGRSGGNNKITATRSISLNSVKASWIRFSAAKLTVKSLKVFGEESVGTKKLINSSDIVPIASSVGESVMDEEYEDKALGCDPLLTVDNALYQTYWTSQINGAGTDDWIYYDLGDTYMLDSVVMHYIGGNFDLEVYTSSNGSTWDLATTKTLTEEVVNETYLGKCVSIPMENAQAKYVKLKKASIDEEDDAWKVGNVKFIEYSVPEDVCKSTGIKIVEENGNETDLDQLYAGKIRVYREIQIAESSTEGKLLCAGIYDKVTREMKQFVTKTVYPEALTSEEFFVEIDVDETLGIEPYGLVRENLARGCNARFLEPTGTSEIIQSGTAYATNAVDGSMDTYSCAAGHWNYILEVDLGEIKKVGQVVLYMAEDRYPLNYDVLISDDGVEWKTVAAIEGNSTAGKKVFNFDPKHAQYVRVRDNLAQANIRQMHIQELEVYENGFANNYELRAFAIDNLTDKLPLGNSIDILD